VYGIYRAKRAPTTEAIVLSTPYQPKMKGNAYGAATMLALAKYFQGKGRRWGDGGESKALLTEWCREVYVSTLNPNER